ncbi:lanthionine biosynthesis protein [Marivirga lumbricoides]|uniref:Lanthionine biosynthesis protein n=1 Tax=Marivirga lumbricoides TaxID=1046115 RepID=A0ABQ1N5B1_9BACT|nr:lanthionine biosynthesis protein [Marivirga lumbricoides]
MNLFPHILCRIAGGSFNEFAEKMCFHELKDIVSSQFLNHQKRNTAKLEFCENLKIFIKNKQDSKIQNLLQNFRRDVYNDRRIKEETESEIRSVFNSQLNEEWGNYLQIVKEQKALQEKAEIAYNQEINKTRGNIKSLLLKDNLQNGLLLSSNTLLDQIPKIINKHPKGYSKKEIKVELSLLQYLSRIYTKTSPFSSFTNLTLAEAKSEVEELIKLTEPADSKELITSHVRLNNYLFKYLKSILIQYRPAYLKIYIRPNPTIEIKENHFHYLTNIHNIESFQQISTNAFLNLLLDLLKENKQGKRFEALINDTIDQVNATETEVENYIVQLVNLGFLEYNFQVSGLDPDWDLKMIDTFGPLIKSNALIEELVQSLISIRKLMQKYQKATVEARKVILKEVYSKFKNVCFKIHKAVGLPEDERVIEHNNSYAKSENSNNNNLPVDKERPSVFIHNNLSKFNFKPEQLLYEDTSRSTSLFFDKESLQDFVSKLDGLLQELKLFKGDTIEKLKMQHYFLQKYEKQAHPSVLEFYQKYYKDLKLPELALQENLKKDSKHTELNDLQKQSEGGSLNVQVEKIPPVLEKRFEDIRNWKENFLHKASFSGINKSNEVILNKTNLLFQPKNTKERSRGSLGAFIQFYVEKDKTGKNKLKGVLNNSFPGYGKMMSRFLHVFNDQVSDDIRKWNLKLSDGELHLENCDASYFNANIHPSLMPYEIQSPGGNNIHFEKTQIPVKDFDIVFKEDDYELQLQHKPTGKASYVYDLGFQSRSGRSKLFQLLDQFTLSEYLSVQPMINSINSQANNTIGKKVKSEQIEILPRVVYEDQIILQRKSWVIVKHGLPDRKHAETNAEFYSRMQIWRKEQGIPDEVFVSILRSTEQSTIDKRKHLSRDDYKPQYINFNNPLLVNIFEKMTNKTFTKLRIQEMLPSSEQLLEVEGKKIVSEFMVQWYNF